MPRFTRENAAEMARRARLARTSNVNKRTLDAAPANETAEDERKRRMGVQIDLLDADIAKTKNPVLRCRLIAAKAKLWELIYPKPGSLKPGKQRRETRAPISPLMPQPIETAAPLVAGDPDQNHNGENVQSQVSA